MHMRQNSVRDEKIVGTLHSVMIEMEMEKENSGME